MKIKLIKILLPCLYLTLAVVKISVGQCDKILLPEEAALRSKAEESYALLKDHKNAGHFTLAAPRLNWLLANTPQMHVSIYVYGVHVYEELAKAESDPGRKRVYVDSLMVVYDLRIQNCGEETSIINRKAIHAYMFNINTRGKEKELLDLMDKTFELNGHGVIDATLVPYMQVIMVNKINLKNLTDDEILKRYNTLVEIIDAKKAGADATTIEKLNRYMDQINEMLFQILDKKSCELIKKILEPKFRTNPSDTAHIKTMFAMMYKNDCTSDPLWIEVVKAQASNNENVGLTIMLASKFFSDGDMAQAEEFFKNALSQNPDPDQRTKILMHLASLELKKGNKAAARDRLFEVIKTNPGYKDAYKKLGDLYMSAFHDCAKSQHQAKDRLVIIAAYEMYEKAGDKKGMEEARKNFPSIGEIFELNWKKGEEKKIEDCWVNETVILRTRD